MGTFLAGSDQFREAVVVPEPDNRVESLPLYAGNPIYFPPEGRFGTTVGFTTRPAARISLAEVIAVARNVKADSGRPVLLVLGHRGIQEDPAGLRRLPYGRGFTWTAEQLR